MGREMNSGRSFIGSPTPRVPVAASSERGSVSRSTSANRELPEFARLPRFQSAAGHRPALRSGARASARFSAQTFVVSKTNSHITNIRSLKRRERRAPVASPLSLTPGFSPVWHVRGQGKLFQQFSRAPKPLKRFPYPHRLCTGLKPGVNEYLNPFGIHFGLRRLGAAATALSHARRPHEFAKTIARAKSGSRFACPRTPRHARFAIRFTHLTL
jgi:hypothetical protein